ncbi:MAG: DUF4180 domain-containing protein [Dehalococcoidia bacterium]|nr:DUF4180 domain-containing protein [Dehalococcoidia bacterium]
MPYEVSEIAGRRCLVYPAEELVLRSAHDGTDVVGEAIGEGARVAVVPVEAVDPGFFQLRTGVAGEVVQKTVNYGLQLAIVGDIDTYVAASKAFRDFVVECERSNQVIFERDMAALERRLAGLPAR